MPRLRKADPPVDVRVSLPSTLVARLDILLWDHVLNKPAYGKRSEIITRLLTDYVEREETSLALAETEPQLITLETEKEEPL